MKVWGAWKYKNIILSLIGLTVALILFRYEGFHLFLLNLGQLGYIGAFIAGIFFVSIFTVASGTVILLVLAESLSVIELGIIAGLGAVVGDFVIFRFIRSNLIEEIKLLYNSFGGRHLTKLLDTKYFSWTLPVIGAILIASPFPDEIGVTLMGISRMKTYQFLIISFILNAVGIFLIISVSLFIKP